jgi:hypothetical protein
VLSYLQSDYVAVHVIMPPTVTMAASNDTWSLGAALTLSAWPVIDTDGASVTAIDWDLDGDGTFETPGGTTTSLTTTYLTPGLRQIGVRVTDNYGQTATATTPVDIVAAGIDVTVD